MCPPRHSQSLPKKGPTPNRVGFFMPEIINARSHPKVKAWAALGSDPKARREQGSFLLEGDKLCADALESGAKARQAIFTATGAKGRAADAAARKGVPVQMLGDLAFAALSDTRTPQGVALIVERPAPSGKKHAFCVAAEGLQDPGNLGTLLRSAWAAGCGAAYLSEGCADAFSPKALRAGAGAQLHLEIEGPCDLPDTLAQLKAAGLATLALDVLAKQSLWDCDLRQDLCLVTGAEGQGLSRATLAACGSALKLEYPGQAESLNAGVSISIALFEALRQRLKK